MRRACRREPVVISATTHPGSWPDAVQRAITKAEFAALNTTQGSVATKSLQDTTHAMSEVWREWYPRKRPRRMVLFRMVFHRRARIFVHNLSKAVRNPHPAVQKPPFRIFCGLARAATLAAFYFPSDQARLTLSATTPSTAARPAGRADLGQRWPQARRHQHLGRRERWLPQALKRRLTCFGIYDSAREAKP